MLFSFDKFWRTLVFMVLCWGAYGVWGYEFISITLLSAILVTQWNQK